MGLVHATSGENIESILENGILLPEEKKSNYPNSSHRRVYLQYQEEGMYGFAWGPNLILINDLWVRDNSQHLLGFYAQDEFPELQEEFKEYLAKYNIKEVADGRNDLDFAYFQVVSEINIPEEAITGIVTQSTKMAFYRSPEP